MIVSDFFKGKVVLITGASTGIGKEMARKILDWGGSVVITGRNQERLKDLEQSWIDYRERIFLMCSDTKDAASCVFVMDKTIERFGKLDVLVCNAALSSHGEIENMPVEVIHNVIDTNLKGPIFFAKAAADELRKTKGSILLVSSLAGLRGLPLYGLYSLSKMALTSLSQVLRAELSIVPVKVGIAYVSFTENEASKKMLNIRGEEVVIPSRNKWFSSTREQTAMKLLHQIASGKKSSIHSALGKLHAFLVKFTPGLIGYLARLNYLKNRSVQK